MVPKLGDYCRIDFLEEEDDTEAAIVRGARQCLDRFYAHAKRWFREAGLQENQIEIKVKGRILNVGKAIVAEAKKGDYGTVVVGRRGISGAFFMGSVSRYVIDKISDRTVWLVN